MNIGIRFWIMWVAAVAVVVWYYYTDPSEGAETIYRLQWLAWVVVSAGPAYVLRRVLMDGARSRSTYLKAIKTSTGAGLVFLGLSILTAALFMAIVGRASASVPDNAKKLLPVLEQEASEHWRDLGMRSVLAAQIEQETCISLKHRYCWSPTAELKTSREYGFGLGQHTRAFRTDGTMRFDAHAEALERYPGLHDWTWDNRFDARLQIRAIVLSNRDCYRKVSMLGPDQYNSLAFCDSAHNGGFGAMLNERRICSNVEGCNPNKWFGNVEHHSLKNRIPHPGYRLSWFGINREHVQNVMCYRRGKYMVWLGETT